MSGMFHLDHLRDLVSDLAETVRDNEDYMQRNVFRSIVGDLERVQEVLARLGGAMEDDREELDFLRSRSGEDDH